MEELDPRLPPIVSPGTIAKPGIRVLKPETVREQRLMPIVPVDWIVEGIVAQGSVTVLSGPSGVGKSWTVLHMAMKVAEGGLVNGLLDTKQGNVLWIDNENGPFLTRRRSRLLDRGKLLVPKGTHDIFIDSQMGWKLDPEDMELWHEAVDTYKPLMLVFDSFNTILPKGSDENDASSVRLVLDALGKFLKFNRDGSERVQPIGALVIHHTGKSLNADGKPVSRGSSGIKDAAEICYMVNGFRKTDEATGEERGFIELYCDGKNRLAEEDRRHFIAELKNHGQKTDDDFWVEYLSHGFNDGKAEKTDDLQGQILGALKDAGDKLTAKQINEALGGEKSDRRVREVLQELADKMKVIIVPNEDENDRTRHYRLI